MTIQLKLLLLAISVAAVFLSGWLGHTWYSDSSTLKIERAIKAAGDKASDAAAKSIAEIKITNTQVMGKVIERIKVETVYADCKHSQETFLLIQEAFR